MLKNKYLRQTADKLFAICLICLLGVIVLLAHGGKAYADDTNNYPWIRPDNWLSQLITKPTGGTGSGHIGVDIQMSKPGQSYNPCQNTLDTYIAACDSPGGYYKVERYISSSSDFPYGIFIDNSNNGQNHYWARRINKVYLETYPYSVSVNSPLSGYRLDPGACNCTVYGGFQVIIDDWKGGYSSNISTLRNTSFADSDVGKMNGFIKRSGVSVGQSEVNISWFGQDKNITRSSTGFPVYSFASWPTNQGGYYTSGPVLKDNYHIFVTDNGPGGHGPTKTVECVGISVQGWDRLDMELTSQHFGLDGPGRQCYDR